MRSHRSFSRPTLLLGAAVLLLAMASPSAAFGATYFVSNSNGSDANNGTSSSTPWKTLAKVQATALNPGDEVEFRRGDTWTGGLTISRSGSSGSIIALFGYGPSSDARPLITGGANGSCFKVTGSWVQIDNLKGSTCGYAGVEAFGDHVTVKNASFTGNAVGIRSDTTSSFDRFTNNSLTNNNILNVNNSSGSSGAFGVLLNGDDGEVDHNTITGSRATSLAYGWDGSAVEVFNGSRNTIHHNTTSDNDAMVELGGNGDANRVEYNRASSNTTDTVATGIVLPGSITGTWLTHNTIYLVGSNTQALVCYSSCAPSTNVRDNVLRAEKNALWMDGLGWTVEGNVINGPKNIGTLPGSNTTASAALVNPPTDLHLTSTSPAIDRGTTTPYATDLDDFQVPVGPASDSGAYEAQNPGPPPPTPQCSDGVDNDSDGAIDFPADTGCTDAQDNDETNAPPPPPDTTPPDTSITGGPSGTVSTASASFTFTATETGSTFQCRLDGAAFTSCTSPQAYSSLANGSHTFDVRATDPAGNTDPTPASRTWTVNVVTPPPGAHVLAAAGDFCGSSTCTGAPAETAANIRAIAPERFLGLGDYQYQNAGSNGATFISGWQSKFATGVAPITIPAFGATHDTCDGSGIWECYPVSYFNANGAPEVRGKLFDHQWGYSVDIGAWHVVVFNYRDGTPAQMQADLAAHPSQCLLAIDHAPVYGSPSSEHPSNEASAFKQTLLNNGVDLILNGHQHFYERNVADGLTEITNGLGGIGHYSRTSTASSAVAYNNTSFGVLRVTLGSNSWSTQFVKNATAAAFTDTASGDCQ